MIDLKYNYSLVCQCLHSVSEKTIVMDLIKAAMSGKDDYYKRDVNSEFIEDPNRTKLPPITESQKPMGDNSDLVKQFDRYGNVGVLISIDIC